MMSLISRLHESYRRVRHENSLIGLEECRLLGSVAPSEQARRLKSTEIGLQSRDALAVSANSQLEFTRTLHGRCRFVSWIGVLQQSKVDVIPVEFSIEVHDRSGIQVVAQREVHQLASRNRWLRFSADLDDFADQEARIVLRTTSQNVQAETLALWADPHISRRRSATEIISVFRQKLRGGGLALVIRTLLTSAGILDYRNPSAFQRMISRLIPLGKGQYRPRRFTPEQKEQIAREISQFKAHPLISIITPVFNPHPDWLKRCIDSVREQYYSNWELCLCDDASSDPGVRQLLSEYVAMDSRIKVRYSPVNVGISSASNIALELATGEFVGFLDHDDELTPDAVFEVVRMLQQHPDTDMVYSDEDKLEVDGSFSEPFFKPDWSPEYLRSCMYTCHFAVYRRALVLATGRLRCGFEGSQDYDLALRIMEKTDRVLHVPKVLYHWRRVPGSTAMFLDAKSYSDEAGRKALKEHLERVGLEGTVESSGRPNLYRIRPVIKGEPLVSIIIPTRDNATFLRRCIASLREKTSYPNYELLIIDNDSKGADTRRFLTSLPDPVLNFAEPFNFSRINNFAAAKARGEYLLFLNDDTEVITPEWLTAMLECCQVPGVGVVGAKLLFPSGHVQHAGIVLGIRGVAGSSHKYFSDSSPGYFQTLNSIRNYSAVTAACMLVRREVFDLVCGFDESLPVAFNDVDFCLRVRERGFRIAWTPYAKLYHHESASRGYSVNPTEIKYMRSRWGAILDADQYYNPNLTLDTEDFAMRT